MAALHTLSPIGRHPCSHVAQAPVRSGASRLGSGVCARMSSHLGMSIREAVKMWSRASARAHLPCVRASLRMLSDHAKRAWSESICMSTRLPRRHRPGRPGATSLKSASTTRHFECALPRPRPPQSPASAAQAVSSSVPPKMPGVSCDLNHDESPRVGDSSPENAFAQARSGHGCRARRRRRDVRPAGACPDAALDHIP